MTTKDARETSADRWSSWRRGVILSVIPSGTRLYRVVACNAERIIGLPTTQMSEMGTPSRAIDSAGDLLAYLERTGSLRAWEYRVSGNNLEGWRAEPTRQISLFARRTIRIEPFDPTDPPTLGNTSRRGDMDVPRRQSARSQRSPTT